MGLQLDQIFYNQGGTRQNKKQMDNADEHGNGVLFLSDFHGSDTEASNS